jgi:hypothetical protein
MQYTKVIKKELLITIDDLAVHKQKHLMQKLLIMVIGVNLMVLLSIILCT